MIKVNWDVEELVALIDVYRRSDEKSAEQIEVELLALSKAFVERAERLGIEHDEKYRNLNGMKMMFQNVAYVASNGDHGMSAEYSARDCAPQPLKLSIHSGGIEHPCRCR